MSRLPLALTLALALGVPAHAQEMYTRPLGSWSFAATAQAFPVYTRGFADSADIGELYLTQPVLMMNLESPGSRLTLRTTLNFEGITQPDGELTFGGWGEGFIDRRHPHTIVHEAMLSLNFWNVAGGSASISAAPG